MNNIIIDVMFLIISWNRKTLIGILLLSVLLLLIVGGTAVIIFLVENHRKNRKVLSDPISLDFNSIENDIELAGFAYDKEQDIFYSVMNCWQRDFGYCQLYDDAAAPLSMIIDCEPIRFEYDGKKWLIEFWKGQYGMTTGCEVGVYNTSETFDIPILYDGTFYYSVPNDEMLQIDYSLRKNGTLLFNRSGIHWWLTGFILGEFSDPQELVLDVKITLKDNAMLCSFLKQLMIIGYSEYEIQVENTSVYFSYVTPHNPQPITKTPLTISIMQNNNQFYCRLYQELPDGLTSSLQKLSYVKGANPKLYKKLIAIGKPQKTFKGYRKIKKYRK